MKKSFQSDCLAQARNQVAAIEQAVAKPIDFSTYEKYRMELNIPIISAIFGAEIKDGKVSFNKPLPRNEDILNLYTLMADFITRVEEPLMKLFDEASGANQSLAGMAVPPSLASVQVIPRFQKIKVKDVKSAIIGDGKYAFPMVRMTFTASQVLEMAALAEDLRKVIRRNQVLIIGGVTLAVAATTAVVVGCYYYNKKKEEEQLEDIEDDELDDLPEVVDLSAI